MDGVRQFHLTGLLTLKYILLYGQWGGNGDLLIHRLVSNTDDSTSTSNTRSVVYMKIYKTMDNVQHNVGIVNHE